MMTIPLITIAAILAVLVILLFVVKKRKYVWLLIIVVAGAGTWYGYRLFNRKNPDLFNVKADVKLSAIELIHEYEANDSVANLKYLGKIVEVDGPIKKIEKDDGGYYTVVLGDASTASSVRCAMDTTHRDAALLAEGSSAILRGNCTGFNKDEMGLGSDVILNFAVIIKDKK